MATDKYLSLFYPFDQLDLVKKGIASTWNVSGDRTMVALTMTFMDEPIAKNMSFQREYAEPYDWVAPAVQGLAFTLSTSILYYNDYDSIDEDARGLYRKAMAAFGGIAPSYHIELLDKPTIYWDFHSLLLGIQMMFSFMLVDDDQPLRLCKHCQKVFLGQPVQRPPFAAHGARTSTMSTRAVRNPRGKQTNEVAVAAAGRKLIYLCFLFRPGRFCPLCISGFRPVTVQNRLSYCCREVSVNRYLPAQQMAKPAPFRRQPEAKV